MAMNYVGIMYFPLNVNFFDDAPIELIEAKCGLAAIAAVMKLLCKLHKEKGYYLNWDKEQCMLFAHKAGIGEECMEEIIKILVEKNFFDRTCYETKHVLTSLSIQKIWLEATKRRKKDSTPLLYLLDELKTEEENGNGGDDKNGTQKKAICMQNADNLPEKADNSEQSKVNESKADIGGGSPAENLILTPPGYAYNRQTHNYDGLLFTLQQMRITDSGEINAILRLSDYGRLKGYVWQVIHATRWGEVAAKGKYLIAALVKERKRKSAEGN